MTACLVEVSRGDIVESQHAGAVSVMQVDGRRVASTGDDSRLAYFRSSAKPFQAVPLVESGAADRYGFTTDELAIACSSHDALPWQQEIVVSMLGKIGLDPSRLQCGIALPYNEREAARVTLEQVPPSPLQCDCSGKHAGMLATCMHLGYPIDSYLESDHPLQRDILHVMAKVLRVDMSSIHLAPDGCSVPTFGAPIQAFAIAFATLAAPEAASPACGGTHAEALNRLRSAMITHPQHIAGPGELDTDVMEVTRGRIVAKLGAEGLICLAVPERGLGIAISMLDGGERGRAPATISALEQLGLLSREEMEELKERQDSTVKNFNGWQVGEFRPVFELTMTA